MSRYSSNIYSLREIARDLFERHVNAGIGIPEDLEKKMEEFIKSSKAFLQASQEEFDSKERDNSLKQMVLFIWRTFFNNVLQKIDDYYRDNFELYRTFLFNEKDYGKTVVATDIREKIQAIHEMLKSWPHMIPPRIEDIRFPKSRLVNNMIYETPTEYGIKPIKTEYGFVEPPSLKQDVRPLSIQDYLATQYKKVDDCVDDPLVMVFANYASGDSTYDPCEEDPTFLEDVMKRYGSKGYSGVYGMFPNQELSDYHPSSE